MLGRRPRWGGGSGEEWRVRPQAEPGCGLGRVVVPQNKQI